MKNVKVNGNWDILLPEHRADRPDWYTEKGWERERMDSMYRHLVMGNDPKKEVMFYVGAEEGDMAGVIASWGVTLGLFEPNDKVWPNIKAIWEANNLPDPTFTFSGFAANKSTHYISAFKGNGLPIWPESANGPLIGDHGFRELWQPGDIPQIRIDDIPITPTALSIDVEGSEWEVLRGTEKTIIEHHPKIWLSGHPEFMFKMFGEYMGDLRNWLKDRGYSEQLLAYDHELHFLYLPL